MAPQAFMGSLQGVDDLGEVGFWHDCTDLLGERGSTFLLRPSETVHPSLLL